MAYNNIPSTHAEARSAASHMGDAASDAILLYSHLTEKYPEINEPLAFDPSNRSIVKIRRALQNEFTIRDIKRQLSIEKLKPDFGEGSRGNRGLGNQGGLFEIQLQKGFDDWIENNTTSGKYSQFIKDLVKHYKLEDCTGVKIIAEGAENKKRPMKLVNKHWQKGDASLSKGYDIGATVTDLTLEVDCKEGKTRKYYLSLKTSGTTNLSNLGLKTSVFPVNEIKAGEIKQLDGLALMRTFGLDNDKLCATFNEFESGSRTYSEKDSSPDYNRPLLRELIKGSLGYGYYYVHQMRSTIKHFEITEQFLKTAAEPSGVRIAYGGETGGAKRINIHLTTPQMDMMFNIRNTSASGSSADPNRVYPDKLQSAYKMKGESMYTEVND